MINKFDRKEVGAGSEKEDYIDYTKFFDANGDLGSAKKRR